MRAAELHVFSDGAISDVAVLVSACKASMVRFRSGSIRGPVRKRARIIAGSSPASNDMCIGSVFLDKTKVVPTCEMSLRDGAVVEPDGAAESARTAQSTEQFSQA